MQKNSSNAAAPVIVIAVLLIGGAVAVALFGFLFFMKSESVEYHREVAHAKLAESIDHSSDSTHRIVLQASELHQYGAEIPESGLTLTHYTAITHGQSLTKLAKNKFYSSLSGTPIRWTLSVREVESKDDLISASLSHGYRIESHNSSMSGSSYFTALFPSSAEDQLIQYKTGDLITLSGVLKLDQNQQVTITEAKIVQE